MAAKKKVKKGDIVKVHYTCMLPNGTMIDRSPENEPLRFRVGEREVIADLEKAVIGLKAGESKTETVPAGLAYGPYHDEWVLEIPKDKLPAGMKTEVGLRVELPGEDGKSFIAAIKHVSISSVMLDFNHPLAGKDLTFEITMLDIQSVKAK
ncbi:MAG: peptidylprolyl isomerase [Thermodesulfovibrionales bacterium]|nr:peptidylprolyl isomerase [Thermodesulfovibrionales bacterium]